VTATGTSGWPVYAGFAVNGARGPGRQLGTINSASNLESDVVHIVRCNAGDVISLYVNSPSGAISVVGGALGGGENVTAIQIQQFPDTAHAPSAVSASAVVGGRLYQQTTGKALNATAAVCTFDTTDYDLGGFAGTVNRLTVPTGGGGTYRLSAQARVTGLASGTLFEISIRKNGTTVVAYGSDHAAGASALVVQAASTVALNAGDYVEVLLDVSAGTPTTVVGTGNTFLEAIRQNSIALTDPTVATGDMIVRGSGGALARLPVGATGSIPISDPTQPLGIAWTARYHGAKVFLSANQTGQAVNVWNAASFDSELWDTDNYHDNITNKSRLTVPTGLAGKIELKGQVYMSGTSVPLAVDTEVAARWLKNGVTEVGRNEIQAPHNTSIGPNTMFQVFGEDLAAVGDYYELQVFIATGTENYRMNGAAGGPWTWATIKLLG
jgi:hypothetical protein